MLVPRLHLLLICTLSFFYRNQKLQESLANFFRMCVVSCFCLSSPLTWYCAAVVATQCVIYFMTGVNQHSGAVSSPAMWDLLWYYCMCSINMMSFLNITVIINNGILRHLYYTIDIIIKRTLSEDFVFYMSVVCSRGVLPPSDSWDIELHTPPDSRSHMRHHEQCLAYNNSAVSG